MNNIKHIVPVVFLLLAFNFSACTLGVRLPSAPVSQEVDMSSKQVPPESKISGTQHPYIINGKKYYPLPSAHGFEQSGIASWYGRKFHGKKTSNGETYDMYAMTAAHKTLPMNTRLLVKNIENNKEIVVRVNDRGPFVKGRILDLSLTGARKLGILDKGTSEVKITALGEAIEYQRGGKSMERFLTYEDLEAGEFFIQVGSFTNNDNATRLKDKMLSWGRKAVIVRFDLGDKVFYRVQVRAGTNLAEAKRMERVMEKAGFPGAFMVAR
ncbi:MAG: septal ring lytic transglycosylase RlpA family protein [Proteobacteria bacterium]|nr:septal ring lytic transglycosylase RlpA family protein [Pseudomonadota bacterium]MBU1715729.1 septal ring lytic transglycosylase RlpA family protein [Pseudomonadota bacterium]